MEAKDAKKIVEAIDALKSDIGDLMVMYSELSNINLKLDKIIELLQK